jgi:hypothetical protein
MVMRGAGIKAGGQRLGSIITNGDVAEVISSEAARGIRR